MIQLYWKCPKYNGVNVISPGSNILRMDSGWESEDEYDFVDGSITLKDRCEHCQYLVDENLYEY